jgi:gluconate 2-dehydrogenase gamma chain
MDRRNFIGATSAALAGISTGCGAHSTGTWRFLSDAEAHTLSALCDQIIPADQYPSASQAGVVNYIDLQLTHRFHKYQSAYRRGLRRAEELAVSRCGQSFTLAHAEERTEIVQRLEHEDGRFFDLLLAHSLQGYYGSPRHGGNRDATSWRMLGLFSAAGQELHSSHASGLRRESEPEVTSEALCHARRQRRIGSGE